MDKQQSEEMIIYEKYMKLSDKVDLIEPSVVIGDIGRLVTTIEELKMSRDYYVDEILTLKKRLDGKFNEDMSMNRSEFNARREYEMMYGTPGMLRGSKNAFNMTGTGAAKTSAIPDPGIEANQGEANFGNTTLGWHTMTGGTLDF